MRGLRGLLIRVLCGGVLLATGCVPPADNTSTDSLTTKTPIETALGITQGELVAASAAPTCVQFGEPASTVHVQMFQELNAYRAQNGLKPLLYSKRLETAANAHAKDMYDRNFFAHLNPDGKNPGDRALDARFCHKYVGENLAAGQPNADAAMLAWENSPPHNENMLDADYVYAGMGYYIAPTGRQYWVQEMALDVP